MDLLNPNMGALRPFSTVGWRERQYLASSIKRPLSGYLGGEHKGGYWVERLSDEWCSTFHCQYATPCNSATSGLLAACIAVGVKPGDLVYAPVYTMSATASCAKMLGADVELIDIESARYSLHIDARRGYRIPKAVIVTNLFGHPAYLHELRKWCDLNNVYMIEDNAQGIFSKIGNTYAGTIGHIGVFSLNVHKHCQTGEGGVVVTNSSDLNLRIKDAINHGELRKGGIMGLNLRMTEPIAALGCAQLNQGPDIIRKIRELALEISECVTPFDYIRRPLEGVGCTPVYYQWAAKVLRQKRTAFVMQLNWHGFPMRPGYSPLLSDVFNIQGHWPIATEMEDEVLITYEICAYDLSSRQRRAMREIFKIVGERVSQIKGD